MKIVILHQHFRSPATGGALRSYFLAKALLAKGHDVAVVSGHEGNDIKRENIEGIRVDFLPVAYDNRFGFYRRIFSFYRFYKGAIRQTMKAHRDANLCYAISVPLTTGLSALKIRQRLGIPFIFEVGDLWPDAPIELGFVKNRLLKSILFSIEKKIYQQADAIVALSPAIAEGIQAKTNKKSVEVIPNMSDTDFFQLKQKDAGLEEKFGVKGKFVISYIGAIGFANGLDHFLECARACERADLPVKFILCGDGAMLANLKTIAAAIPLRNLSIIGHQNRDGVSALMNITDATFISYRPAKILETGSPNKYFDGLAAGKIIIVNFGGWVREEIEREQCGFFVPANDPGEIVLKLRTILADEHGQNKMKIASRRVAERKYARPLLEEKAVRLIEQFVK